MYTMAAVSRRTGVRAGTLRAWERRYGFPSPQRAPGGQRLYTDRDLQAVSNLRTQTVRGVPISRAIALLLERHRSARAESIQTGAHSGTAPFASDDLLVSTRLPRDDFHRRLLAALLDLAPRRAEIALSEALAVLSIEDVCLGLIEPVLNEVGDRWHAGRASIAQEHFASAFLRIRVAAMFVAFTADDDRPAILAACPQGE
jgi:DNA-binding transcriptional MerR regulator